MNVMLSLLNTQLYREIMSLESKIYARNMIGYALNCQIPNTYIHTTLEELDGRAVSALSV
jgi:hypothetical protein